MISQIKSTLPFCPFLSIGGSIRIKKGVNIIC
jgi:hypothetical protein